MIKLLNSRYSIIWVIAFFYAFPLFLISGYSLSLSPLNQSWKLFSFGLFLSAIGSLCFYVLLYFCQKEAPAALSVAPLVVDRSSLLTEEHLEELRLLREALANKLDEVEQLKYDHERELTHQKLEIEFQWKTLLEEHQEQTFLLESAQQAVTEQQNLIDKKHQMISQLETKVGDLNYEIKTLLHLGEDNSLPAEEEPLLFPGEEEAPEEFLPSSEKLIHTTEEASLQLKRCINIAQKITRPQYGYTTSQLLPMDNYALDMRHLFDNLRSETNSTILFFSPKEEKLLFANNQVKSLLGWNPEKMIQSFDDINQHTLGLWKNTIAQLSPGRELKINLMLKNRAGNEIEIKALVGMIPTGLFRQYIIAILY